MHLDVCFEIMQQVLRAYYARFDGKQRDYDLAMAQLALHFLAVEPDEELICQAIRKAYRAMYIATTERKAPEPWIEAGSISYHLGQLGIAAEDRRRIQAFMIARAAERARSAAKQAMQAWKRTGYALGAEARECWHRIGEAFSRYHIPIEELATEQQRQKLELVRQWDYNAITLHFDHDEI